VIGMWILSPVGIINALAAAIGLLLAGVLVALLPRTSASNIRNEPLPQMAAPDLNREGTPGRPTKT